jgi:hypothetical protein
MIQNVQITLTEAQKWQEHVIWCNTFIYEREQRSVPNISDIMQILSEYKNNQQMYENQNILLLEFFDDQINKWQSGKNRILNVTGFDYTDHDDQLNYQHPGNARLLEVRLFGNGSIVQGIIVDDINEGWHGGGYMEVVRNQNGEPVLNADNQPVVKRKLGWWNTIKIHTLLGFRIHVRDRMRLQEFFSRLREWQEAAQLVISFKAEARRKTNDADLGASVRRMLTALDVVR